MKGKTTKIIIFTTLILATMLSIILSIPSKSKTFDDEQVSLYSTTNAPIFYGTTAITIDKTFTDTFDIHDSRFRIYARDFEDGDLTQQIEVLSNNVVPNVAGDYQIKYRVCDSHNNKITLTVPVTVTNDSNGKCQIERTLYTVPSIWHLSAVKVLRFHYGDKQNLGIYLPEDTSVKIKVLSADKDIKLTFWGNDSGQESSKNILCSDDDFVEYKNVRNGISYDSIPFAQSVIQDRGIDVNKTYSILLEYDNTIPTLDLFYDGDDDAKFVSDWQVSENTFALVESASIAIIVPYSDINNLPNGTASGSRFLTLQTFIEFFNTTVKRMGSMIGLSLNPTRATDQEIPSKVFLKADFSQKAGLAFYANGSDYVGLSNRTSVSAYFDYGWGTLHEIGHGSQGYFGRGIGGDDALGLQEVGNNVLAYYIQSDKSLYLPNHKWLGDLDKIETDKNNTRLSGKTFYQIDVVDKLYVLINLLNTFEGEVTYSKIFSMYRDLYITQNKVNMTIADVYALCFAEEYNVNILPYFETWHINVSDNTRREIMQRSLTPYYVTGETVADDTLTTIKAQNNISLTYGLVSQDVLDNYGLKSKLNLTLNIDDFSKIQGKTVALYQNGECVVKQVISSKTLSFDDLNLGVYEVQLPIDFGYDNDYLVAVLKEGVNNITYTYSTDHIVDYSYCKSKLVVLGIHKFAGSIGCQIQLSDQNHTATISYGGADLGNRSGVWTTTRIDDTFIKITIVDLDENVVFEKQVKGNEYFSTITQTLDPISIQWGYKIVVYTERPDLVKVVSNQTGNELTAYNSTQNTLTYEITKYGLKLTNIENFDEHAVLYQDSKQYLIDKIQTYKDDVTTDEIQNRRINPKQKVDVLCAYKALKSEDRVQFDQFIQDITSGGAPTITLAKDNIQIKRNNNFDFYSLLTIYDNEDGEIVSSAQNTLIQNFDKSKLGTQSVTILVFDSDNNANMVMLTVKVVKPNETIPIWIIIVVVSITLLVATSYVLIKIKHDQN